MRLLDEPEPAAAEPLVAQLAAMQADDLERIVVRCNDAAPAVRRNVQAAQVRSRFLALDAQWAEAARRGDLERALTLVSMTAENPPALNIGLTLDNLAQEAGLHLSGDRAFDSGLSVLAEVLFRNHGLRGDGNDYYAPENSYLASVLARGLGNPITLCSVAILVGRRLELPVFGINAPGHFLGFYGDVDLRVGSYFDAFDGFQRLTAGQVQALIGGFVEQFDPAMLQPASDREIISRSVRNLAGSYMRRNEPEQVRNLERWIHLVQP